MAAREDVGEDIKERVFAELGKSWLAKPSEIANKLAIDATYVASALGIWTQNGRAMFDLEKGLYRKRELTRDPLPIEKLRFASEREESAARMLHHGKVSIDDVATRDGNIRIAGRIQWKGRLSTTWLLLDPDRRLSEGECTCDYYIRNRLHRGPCDHMLVLRSAHRRGISDADLGPIHRVETTHSTPSQPSSRPRSPEASPLPASANMSSATEAQLRAALDGLGDGIVITDRPKLFATLKAVYAAVETDNARLFALVAAIRDSPHVSRLPPDSVLIETLRQHLPRSGPLAPSPAQRAVAKRSTWFWVLLVVLVVRVVSMILRNGC
jgi:hypothetical protein